MEKNKTQFSLRAAVVLTTAIAVWVWIFREITFGEMAVFAGAALIAALVGHFVYTFWLPWRVTVIITVWLVFNALLGAQLLLQSGSGTPWLQRLAFLFELLIQPAEMMMRTRSPRDILFSLAIVLGTLIFTPAHAIRPSLPAAIVTAIGISIWYGSSILMMAYGG